MNRFAPMLRESVTIPPAPDDAGRAYDAVARDYLHYADGSGGALFDFDSRYAFADREVWQRIEAALVELRLQGRRTIRILDLGCGPGTWTLRTALRARALGFEAVEARGVDLSAGLIALAHDSAGAARGPGLAIDFAVEDLEAALALEAVRSCDLILCLYGVLNHLPRGRHADLAHGLARAANGPVILTVRAAGSPPSIFVTGIEDADAFHLDHDADRLEVDLKDGRHLAFDSHLFTAGELRGLFETRLAVKELIGLDLFHSRFAHDPRWHGADTPDAGFIARLSGLEHLCADDPALIDHAAHILLSATARPG